MEYLVSPSPRERLAVDLRGRKLDGLAYAWADVVESVYGPTRILKGAFLGTIQNRGTLGPIKFFREHRTPIGIVERAWETAEGLRITARFSNTPLAEESLELARDGALDSLSIGWEPAAFRYAEEDGEMRRLVERGDLFEVSSVAWGASGRAKVAGVYARQSLTRPLVSATQHNAVAIIAYMERLTAQYTSHRRPPTLPEPPRPLVPSYAEWPVSLRPELVTRRMQGIVTQEKAERSYREARHAHRMAWAGWDQAMRERGY
jgi:HK97 family phage prohead protease